MHTQIFALISLELFRGHWKHRPRSVWQLSCALLCQVLLIIKQEIPRSYGKTNTNTKMARKHDKSFNVIIKDLFGGSWFSMRNENNVWWFFTLVRGQQLEQLFQALHKCERIVLGHLKGFLGGQISLASSKLFNQLVPRCWVRLQSYVFLNHLQIIIAFEVTTR